MSHSSVRTGGWLEAAEHWSSVLIPQPSRQTVVQRRRVPPSVSEPVGDGQQQVILLQGLHPAECLLIQSRVASPCIIQQLLLGRVELPDLCHLLWGDQQQLGNGRGGGHCVAVHPVDLKRFRHVFQTLVCEEDLLVAQQHSSSVFYCGQKRFWVKILKYTTAGILLLTGPTSLSLSRGSIEPPPLYLWSVAVNGDVRQNILAWYQFLLIEVGILLQVFPRFSHERQLFD